MHVWPPHESQFPQPSAAVVGTMCTAAPTLNVSQHSSALLRSLIGGSPSAPPWCHLCPASLGYAACLALIDVPSPDEFMTLQDHTSRHGTAALVRHTCPPNPQSASCNVAPVKPSTQVEASNMH